MARVETLHRADHFDLPTQQCRLRHLGSIAARHLVIPGPLRDMEVANLEVYFTLHLDQKAQAFFTSEKIRGSLNPTWKSFTLDRLGEEGVNTSVSTVVVRIWRLHNGAGPHKLTVEWTLDFTGLVYIGDRIQKNGGTYASNTLIFGLFDRFYGAPVRERPLLELSVDNCCLQVEQAALRDSYSTNSLSRIHTILRAIKQTRVSVQRVRANIEEKLSQSQALTQKKCDQEILVLRVSQMRADLERRTMTLQTLKETMETMQANSHQKDVVLKNKFETLQKDKDRLHEKKKSYFDVREDLIKNGAQLVMRRKQLISELALIYPIAELNGQYTICGVRLPNSEDFSGQDETMVAVALGCTCHLVQMVSQFLDVPLRYPLDHRGSRSRIHDHILDKLSDKERDFPLYSKGKERFQFNYGVYLLNKNIAQLRYYCGLGTTDLRLTLPNLKSLLELRLGVKFESNSNTLSGLQGQHASIPPNLGGPQKLTSSFSQQPANQNINRGTGVLANNPGKTAPSEGVDKFEEILSETKSVSVDDRDDKNILGEPSSSQLSVGPHLDSVKVLSQEVLFQGSPDSFFEVKPNSDGVDATGVVVEEGVDVSSEMDGSEAGELPRRGSEPSETSPSPGHRRHASDPVQTTFTFKRNQVADNIDVAKQLLAPLDQYEDMEVSSNDGSTNAFYGSSFKQWPDQMSPKYIAERHSGDEVDSLPPSSNDQSGSSDELQDNKDTADACNTFKTSAMFSGKLKTDSSHNTWRDASGAVGSSDSVQTVSTNGDSIQQRTDALSSQTFNFKIVSGRTREEGLSTLDDTSQPGATVPYSAKNIIIPKSSKDS